MDRRDLLKNVLATAAVSALPAVASARESVDKRPSEGGAQDEPIVVEGLFAGSIRLSHLRGMQQGGVHCGIASGPSDMGSYAALLRFFDQHTNELVLAKSVAEIRRARHDRK